jgi:hypothetical protein
MPLIDYVKLYGSDVARVLAQGEGLVDVGPYREPLAGDESRLERTIDELNPLARGLARRRGPQPPRPDRLVEGFDPLDGLQVNPHRLDRLLGGLSGAGSPESMAGRLWRAARASTGGTYYAVTDRRLLLLADRRPGAGDYGILFELPRSAVVSARRRGKVLLQWGRVEVSFSDGSMKAWTPGMVSTGRARSLVAALS